MNAILGKRFNEQICVSNSLMVSVYPLGASALRTVQIESFKKAADILWAYSALPTAKDGA